MSFDTLSVGVPWDEFETFPQYLDAVERRGTGAQLRLLRRPHRHPPLRDGRRGLRARRHPRRARPHAGGRRRGDGRRCHRLRQQRLPHPQRRPGPAGAVPRRRPRRAAPPAGAAARGRTAASSRCCPAACSRNEQVFDLQREVGRPFTWTALLTIKGFPYHEGVIEEHDDARADGRRRVAAGVVPPARVPDEPGRAVHAQHARLVPGAHEQDPRRAQGGLRDPSWRADGVGRRRPARSTGARCRSPSPSGRPDLVGRLVRRPGRRAGAAPRRST